MSDKRADYFAAGTEVVWDVDLQSDDVVRVYRAADPGPALEQAKGSSQISGDAELERIANQVIAENEKSVMDFKAGKEQALRFLIGQGMKISKGRANPGRLQEVLASKLVNPR